MKSILQEEKNCYVCKTMYDIHKHHVYYGRANRPISEKNGFVVYLCGHHHNLSDEGVHFDKELDLRLKEECQRAYEKTHSREDFMRLIGKNYLKEFWNE